MPIARRDFDRTRRAPRIGPAGGDDCPERGAAILLVVAALSMIILAVITGLVLVEVAANLIRNQLRHQGQTMNTADAG
jgi:hypothetical protein